MGIDYYGVLKLTRSCTELDIKKAYRRLALNFNPGRLKDPTVNDTFALVSEAYEVLVNPLTRAIFDQYGEEGLKRGIPTKEEFYPAYVYHGKPMKTYQEFFGTESPYADLLDYYRNPLPLYDLPEGRGIKRKKPPIYHPLCLTLHELYQGGVKKMKIRRLVFKDETKTTTELKEKVLTIPIKPGLPANTEIVFPEEGDQGPTHIAADIIFVTADRPHEVYHREGDNLVMTQDITLLESLTGLVINVCTLDGRKFRVPITDVVDDGYEKVVPAEGMPIIGTQCKGDLIIRFKVTFPTYFSEKCKEKLKEAFLCADTDSHDPEVMRMVLRDKMERIPKSEQQPTL